VNKKKLICESIIAFIPAEENKDLTNLKNHLCAVKVRSRGLVISNVKVIVNAPTGYSHVTVSANSGFLQD
jgi:hypothetical protein